MRYTKSARKRSNRRTKKVLTMPLVKGVYSRQRAGGTTPNWTPFGNYLTISLAGAANLSPQGTSKSLCTTASVNGTGSAAIFLNPSHICIDSAGYLYILEYGSSIQKAIRQISPQGAVTTLVREDKGNVGGSLGASGDGGITKAHSIMINPTNDVIYTISWAYNKINTIVTGNGMSGSSGWGTGVTLDVTPGLNRTSRIDGPGSGATLYHPHVLCVAPDGKRMYTYTELDRCIRMIDITDKDTYEYSSLFSLPSNMAPFGSVVDMNGNLFYTVIGIYDGQVQQQIDVSKTQYHCIYKISAIPAGVKSGTTSTILLAQSPLPAGLTAPVIFAGSYNNSGYTDDAVGTNARFNRPMGLACDRRNNIYVADMWNNCIRVITPNGAVYTVAGGGTSGGTSTKDLTGIGAATNYGDGPNTNCYFSQPIGITIDAVNNLYVLDTGKGNITQNNNTDYTTYCNEFSRVRKMNIIPPPSAPGSFTLVTTDSISATFSWAAGTGVTGFEQQGFPASLRFSVQKAGEDVASILAIDGTAFDQTKMQQTASQFITTNTSQTQQGYYVNNFVSIPLTPGATYASINIVAFNNAGATFSSAVTNIVVPAASKNYTILKAGTMGSIGFANGSALSSKFAYPKGLCADATNNIYVADMNNHCIRKIDSTGNTTTFFGTPPTAGSSLTLMNGPQDVTFSSNGAWPLYVTDKVNNRILSITSAGVATLFNTSGVILNNMAFITIDSANNIYATSNEQHCIYMITPAGVASVFAGAAGSTGSADGAVASARFNGPQGIHYGATYNTLYITDYNNNILRKIPLTAPYTVSTLAGRVGSAGNQNGLGSVGRFNGPFALTTDLNGNIYVADYNNHSIRKVTPAGLVSIYSGTGIAGSADGNSNPTAYNIISSTATYNAPNGICSGATGMMFVTEQNNHCIRALSPYSPPIAPTSQSLTAVTKTSATIAWDGDTDATSYAFTVTPSSASITIPTVAVGTRTATFTGLTDSTAYSIRLILTNSAGSTFPPAVKCITPIDTTNYSLSMPTAKTFSFTGSVKSLVTISLSWVGIPRVPNMSYTVTPSTGASISGTMPPNQRPPFTVTGLEPNIVYTAKIMGSIPNAPSPTTGGPGPISVTHIRFTVTSAIGGTSNDYAVASFAIINGTSTVAWPANTVVYPVTVGTTTEIPGRDSNDGGPRNLLNTTNSIGKYFPWYPRGTGSQNPAAVIFALGAPTVFSAYKFGVADALSRTPNRWKLEYSTDGTNFGILDDRTEYNQNLPITRNTYTDTYPVNYSTTLTAVSNEVSITTQAVPTLYIGTIVGVKGATPAVTTATAAPTTALLTTQLNTVRDIVPDGTGNFYIAARTCVLKMSPPATPTNLYIFDTTKITPTPTPLSNPPLGLSGSTLTLFAGSATAGTPSTTAQTGATIKFTNIGGMIYNPTDRCLYISDIDNAVVVKLTTTGTPSAVVIAGIVNTTGNADGALSTNTLNIPKGLALDPDGSLYIACFNGVSIRKLSATGTMTTITTAADAGWPAGSGHPGTLTRFPDGSIYVACAYDHTIRKLTPDPANPGSFISSLYAGASAPGYNSGGYADGALLTARFNGPQAITVDSNYNMYVIDSNNYAIRVISGGNVYTLMKGSSGDTDGEITSGSFKGQALTSLDSNKSQPGLFCDAANNLYLSDTLNGTIRLITTFPASQVITQTQLDYYKTSGAQASSAVAQGVSSALAQSISGARASSAVAQVASQAVASSAIQQTALSGPVMDKDQIVAAFLRIKTALAMNTEVLYSSTSTASEITTATSSLTTSITDLQDWLNNLASAVALIFAIAPLYQDRSLQTVIPSPFLASINCVKLYDAMRLTTVVINSSGYLVSNPEVPSNRPFVSGRVPAPPIGATVTIAPTDIVLVGDLTLPQNSTWTSYFDTAARRYFYVNSGTGESSYDHPFPPVFSTSYSILSDSTTKFLPAGWLKLQSTTQNLSYYLNTNSTQTVWAHPAPPPDPSTLSQAPDATLFPSYKKYISTTAPTSGKPFYVNTTTREAQWDFPDVAFNVGPSTAQKSSSALMQSISGAQASSATAQGVSSALAQSISGARASSALMQSISGAQASSATAQGVSSALAQKISGARESSATAQGVSSALAQSISGAQESSATAQGVSSALVRVQASSATAQRASSSLMQSISGAQESSARAQDASSALAQKISGAEASSATAQMASSALAQSISGAKASSAVAQQASMAVWQEEVGILIANKDQLKDAMLTLQSDTVSIINSMYANPNASAPSGADISTLQNNLQQFESMRANLINAGAAIFQLNASYQDRSLQTLIPDSTLSSMGVTKVYDALRNAYLYLDSNQKIISNPITPAQRAYVSTVQRGGGKQGKSRKSMVLFYDTSKHMK